MPGDDTTPVVPYDHCRTFTIRVNQACHVGSKLYRVVGFYLCWGITFAIAAHFRDDYPVTVFHQVSDLWPPTRPAFRKAVQQENQRSRTHFKHIQLQAIGGNELFPRQVLIQAIRQRNANRFYHR